MIGIVRPVSTHAREGCDCARIRVGTCLARESTVRGGPTVRAVVIVV